MARLACASLPLTSEVMIGEESSRDYWVVMGLTVGCGHGDRRPGQRGSERERESMPTG